MTVQFDSRRIYDLWLKVIADEELSEKMLAGQHRELRDSRGLTEEDIAILDALSQEKGMRWNVENLRFRAADHVKTTLQVYLPRTLYLLTKGEEDWLRDLVYEYVAHHRWQELGRMYLAECLRFATYLRERIAKRRGLPEIVDHVLKMELAVVELLRDAAQVPAGDWPRPWEPLDDAALSAARPRRGPAVRLLDLPVDFTEWIQTADPRSGTVKPEPVTLLLVLPSPEETHRVQRLGEGARLLFERCTGDKTVAELTREVEDELGLEPPQVLKMLRRWLQDRTLRV